MKSSIHTQLKDEILRNENSILDLIAINEVLTNKLNGLRVDRTQEGSYEEYNHFWHDFWEKKEYLREDLLFLNNGKRVEKITPLEFKKNVIVKKLKEKLYASNFKTVLEVGSGAGLNLMLLAPHFPDIHFFGLEPTESGVSISNKFILEPPAEFEEAYQVGSLTNVTIIHGNILDDAIIEKFAFHIDFIFTSAVLEQLNNEIDKVFKNIQKLDVDYFMFYEEWFEANSVTKNYRTLVDSDYFRQSLSILNEFDFILEDFNIPVLQPSWMKYGIAYGKKV